MVSEVREAVGHVVVLVAPRIDRLAGVGTPGRPMTNGGADS